MIEKEILEDIIDTAKTQIIAALIKKKLLTVTEGEDWCENHTIILKKKSLFKTVSDKWFNTKEETENAVLLVVKKVL